MNTPILQTERLILRKFTSEDMGALLQILQDPEVNRFLPWYPLKNLQETEEFYQKRYEAVYREKRGYAYAVCLKENGTPIGYIKLDVREPYDLGYGLRKEFWGQGIMTEAANAVIKRAAIDGLPYVTATHDRDNPRSGAVMQKVGMCYEYSYQEQWQPKDIPVIFRMYQRNLDVNRASVYRGYWDASEVHFVEPLTTSKKDSIKQDIEI